MRRYALIKENKIKKIIISGTVISLFILTLDNNIIAKDDGQERYNYYSSSYIDAYSNINDEFDDNFIDIYNNGKYILNDKEYNIKEIYLVKMDDGTIHLIKAGENKIDLLTNNTFVGKKESIVCFRDTSVFYELYLSGKIQKEINLKNIIINDWDGLKHQQTKELKADDIATKKYRTKYGG